MTNPIVKFITEREERIEEQSSERIGNNRSNTIRERVESIGEDIGNNRRDTIGNNNRG